MLNLSPSQRGLNSSQILRWFTHLCSHPRQLLLHAVSYLTEKSGQGSFSREVAGNHHGSGAAQHSVHRQLKMMSGEGVVTVKSKL
ncbi:hypothetical protein [Deinococcus aquatilis]|uniref:hypothetical protein n=1 Tax=Deinococcus aquatilis TaxID=519440 RepID=UPI0012FB86ED|nr:hypothetical protein [Deinococcus aquatilis]